MDAALEKGDAGMANVRIGRKDTKRKGESAYPMIAPVLTVYSRIRFTMLSDFLSSAARVSSSTRKVAPVAHAPGVLVVRRAQLEVIHEQQRDERVDRRRRREAPADGNLARITG